MIRHCSRSMMEGERRGRLSGAPRTMTDDRQAHERATD